MISINIKLNNNNNNNNSEQPIGTAKFIHSFQLREPIERWDDTILMRNKQTFVVIK